MKQFKTVFSFEFLNYVKKKSFIAVTVILMAAIAIMLFIPIIMGQDDSAGGESAGGGAERVAFADASGDSRQSADVLNTALVPAGFELVPVAEDEAGLRALVESGEYEQAVYLTGPLSYTRFVENLSIYDAFDGIFQSAALEAYKQAELASLGVPAGELARIASAEVVPDVQVVATGKDQSQTFFYTYILIFVLYFAILMYGQFVANSVAMEKSSRTMELLITSADPRSLIFGKVFGTGCAGLAQLVVILCTGYAVYNINAAHYADNFLVQSIFSMPLPILGYAILYFVLGFFIYSFLYAAMGSLVSRMEDISTTVTPITFLLIIMFFIVIFSLSSGNVDNPAIVIGSFIPFLSPMAMFTRITMSQVAPWEIALSVGILVATVILIGLLATAIYRMGVLMYGKPPKPKEIFAMLKKNRKQV